MADAGPRTGTMAAKGNLCHVSVREVSPPAWQAAGHHFGWERSARPADAHDAWVLIFPEDSDTAALVAAFTPPVTAAVAGGAGLPPAMPMGTGDDGAPDGWPDGWQGAAAAGFALFLSITTAQAMAIRLAPLLCQILVQRGILSPAMQGGVELCFQEALANALIHGNLDVPSALKKGKDGFLKFSTTIQDRLQNPEYGLRRVEIGVSQTCDGFTLHVGDQGEGYEASALHGAAPREASGRGFLFMQALAQQVRISDGGRCVCLHFSYPPESSPTPPPATQESPGRAA